MRREPDYRTLTVKSELDPEQVTLISERLAGAFGLDERKVARLLAGRPPLTLVLPEDQAKYVANFLKQAGADVEVAVDRGRKRRWPWAVAAVAAGVAVAVLIWPFVEPHVTALSAERSTPVTTTEDVAAVAREESDLFDAARRGDVNAVRRQIMLGAELDATDDYGQTPLMYAVDHGRDAVVNVLLVSGADPNARTNTGWTPLMYAARDGVPARVTELLLAAGANPELRNDAGDRAIDIAREAENVPVIEVLTERDEAVNAGGARSEEARTGSGASSLSARSGPMSLAASGSAASDLDGGSAQERGRQAAQQALASRSDSSTTSLQGQSSSRQQPLADDEYRQIIRECLADWQRCGQFQSRPLYYSL